MRQIVALVGIAFEAGRNAVELSASQSEKKTLECFRVVVAVDENDFAGGLVVAKADVVMGRAKLFSVNKIVNLSCKNFEEA